MLLGFALPRDVNYQDPYNGMTGLMLAAGNGVLPVMQLFLQAGADHTLRDQQGHTALDMALSAGNANTAALLSEIPSAKHTEL